MLSLLALVTGLRALAQEPVADLRLAKPITLHEKFLSLAALGLKVREVTGVVIAVAPAISDRKFTAYFEDQPVSTLMAKLSSAFFLKFERDGQGYRLTLDPIVGREESTLIADEAAARARAARQALDDYVELGHISLDQAIAEGKDLEKNWNSLYRSADEAGRAAMYKRRMLLSNIENDHKKWALGVALGKVSSNIRDEILKGVLVVGSSVPGPGMLTLPPGSEPKWMTQPRNGVVLKSRTVCFVSYDVESQRMYFGLRSTDEEGSGSGTSERMDFANDLGRDPRLQKAALKVRLAKWTTFEDRDVIKRALAEDRADAPTYFYARGVWSVAEHLERLHARSGVPILADAFRTPCSYEEPFDGKTVGEYLDVFNKDRNGYFAYPAGLLRTEGGWLMYRHSQYWQKLAREIPEKVLTRFEAKTNGAESLNLEDASQFANSLTLPQAAGVRDGHLLVRFRTDRIRGSLPSLQLWANLDIRQRQLAAGNGLALAALGGTARDRYVEAIRQSVIESFASEKYIGFLSPAFGRIPDGMGLFAGPTTTSMSPNDHYPRLDSNNSYFSPRSVQVDAFELRFGTSREDSFSVNWSVSKT